MPKIFISHAWEDNEISRKLAKQLKRDGAEIYIYYSQIEIGSYLPEVFSDAIEWCDFLILLWSKASSTSQTVQLEWQKALDLRKSVITGSLDDTEQSATLHGFHFVNLGNFDQGYPNLANLLNLNVAKKSQSADQAGENPIVPKSMVICVRLREQPGKLGDAEAEAMIK